MNFLIIFGHPNGGSFNHRVLQTVQEVVTEGGHSFEYRNLYELNFDPVLRSSELSGYRQGNYPEDVKREQQWVSLADVLVFIYPLWWGGMPAIMKGYIDRVFASGFAYQFNDNRPVALLKGKKVILMSTQGYTREYYDNIGMTQAMLTIEQQGIFSFCGIEPVGHIFFGDAPSMTPEMEKEYLQEVRKVMVDAGQKTVILQPKSER